MIRFIDNDRAQHEQELSDGQWQVIFKTPCPTTGKQLDYCREQPGLIFCEDLGRLRHRTRGEVRDWIKETVGAHPHINGADIDWF